MKKLLLFVILISLKSSLVFSQKINYTIQKSKEFEDEYKKSNIVLSEKDSEGNLLIVRSYNGNGLKYNQGFYVEKYNNDFKLLKEFDFSIDHSNTEKYNTIIGITYLNSIISIIEIFYDLNRKEYICQANSLSNDFKISKKELFIITREDIKNKGYIDLEENCFNQSKELWNYNNLGEFSSVYNDPYSPFANFNQKHSITEHSLSSNFTMTVNNTKTGFVIGIDFNNKKSENLNLYVFDNNLNLKFNSEFGKEINDKKYIFQNIQLSPDAKSVYLLSKSYLKELKDKEKGGEYQFELIKFTEKNSKVQIIKTNEQYINSLKIIFNQDKITCLGFYSNYDEDKFQGISYFSFDQNNLDLLNSKFNPFSEQFMIDKYGKKKDKGLKFLIFKNIFFTPNNDLILNAEEQYITYIANTNRTLFNCDDIISLKLNKNGELVWSRNINKSQSFTDDDSYISYSSIVKDESNYFFINTGEEIKKLSNDRIEFGQVRKNKSNLNIIRINPDGDFDFVEILDDENTAVPFKVSKGFIIDESLIFIGQKGKVKQLLKVTL